MSRFERGIFHKDKLPDPSVAIIYNNGAGDARKARQYKQATDETAARLREHYGLFVPDYTPTRSAKEAEDLVGKAIEEQRGLIIVKGGDGTFSSQGITVFPQDVGDRQMYFQHDGEPQLLTSDSFRVDVMPQAAAVWVSKSVR